jgi:hypothetical protein
MQTVDEEEMERNTPAFIFNVEQLFPMGQQWIMT